MNLMNEEGRAWGRLAYSEVTEHDLIGLKSERLTTPEVPEPQPAQPSGKLYSTVTPRPVFHTNVRFGEVTLML
jgi:hypothetical protein